MTKHPLTDKEALSLFSFEQLMDTSQPISIEDAMRTAADWQLEQVKLTGQCVINELHENNCHIEADRAAAFLEVLIGAMRPTQKTGREGALQAMDRLYEENSEAMKRLAQEDN